MEQLYIKFPKAKTKRMAGRCVKNYLKNLGFEYIEFKPKYDDGYQSMCYGGFWELNGVRVRIFTDMGKVFLENLELRKSNLIKNVFDINSTIRGITFS